MISLPELWENVKLTLNKWQRTRRCQLNNLPFGLLGLLVAQTVKNLPAMQETQVWSLHWEEPLETGLATHSGIPAWRIPWTEEPGGLQSMGSQRVVHDWVTNTLTFSLTHRKCTDKVVISIFFPLCFFLTILLKLAIGSPFHGIVFFPLYGHLWGARRACSRTAHHSGCRFPGWVFQSDCISIHLLTEVAVVQTRVFVTETNKAWGDRDLYAKPSQQN